MTATGHALIGTLIAGKFNDPYLALPIAFASHFVCDLIPHWDSGTHFHKKTSESVFTEAVFDVLTGFVLSFTLFKFFLGQDNYVLLFATIISAQALDWISVPFVIFKIKIKPIDYIIKIQEIINMRLDKPWGIVTQIITIVFLYLLLYR